MSENPFPSALPYDDRLMTIDNPLFGEMLRYVRSQGEQNFRVLRSYFSSPRLFDVYLSGFGAEAHTAVGLSYMSEHTMLAANRQPTVAIDMRYWYTRFADSVAYIDRPDFTTDCTHVQVWSVDPKQCGRNRLLVGVLLSFTERELQDPRLGIEVDNLARSIGFTNKD